MTFTALVVRVLIASPGDVALEREVISETIDDWNAARAVASEVVLMPIRWETHVVPELGVDAQMVVNTQIGDGSDIVIAVFSSRVGTATPRAVSGTVEEVDRAVADGRTVHVWFSRAPIPHDADLEQVAKVRELPQRWTGLFGHYADLADLRYQVRRALDRDVDKLAAADKVDLVRVFEEGLNVRPAPAPGARLRASAARVAGGEYVIEVANSGVAPAEDLSVVLVGQSGGELALNGPQHFDLLDGSSATWHVWLSLADSIPATVRMTWLEAGFARSLEQTVST
ncbi:hypothetical protein DDP54_07740 [Cellulomonas sp. WB94]|uniref:hypothetical protein n=1 Tax=Cellulomonas sp. WB94 TaxID=2173174 RepID=UPI000D57229C|nr:hypothetical protein [Cellulomonas sp. WB94]PVU82911.1 hypothetical protein DDP54_07740 [Cellulomonas sp. WB94]